MRLLISQKDVIFELIQKQGLSPNQFKIEESETLLTSSTTIKFKERDFTLNFISSLNSNIFSLRYTPGNEVFTENIGPIEKFSNSLLEIQFWLNNIYREIQSPNYWEKLDRELEEVRMSSVFNNSKFTIKEFNNLSSKIDFLKSNLKEIPLLKEQNEQIIFQLDNLKSRAEELGKFDWTNLFIGTIMSIIIQLNVNRENADALWQLIKNIFSGYFLE